jgi:nucleotide-binding universal stress UspA family protein
MIKRILVPLDGSALAEAALPAAAALSQKLGAAVTLIHVIEQHPPRSVHGQRHLSSPEEAKAYMAEVAALYFPAGAEVEAHVHTDETADVARGLAGHEAEMSFDLVVMCSHGPLDATRMVFGSIAQRIVSAGSTPVLILRPARLPDRRAAPPPSPGFPCRTILVPVDEQLEHLQALQTAAELAAGCGAALHLLMAVPTYGTLPGRNRQTGRLLPAATARALEISAEGAAELLEQQRTRLARQGLEVRAELARGEPASCILRAAGRMQVDLVVMGTHGSAGLKAFWEGSVANRVSARSRVPLLLVPIP